MKYWYYGAGGAHCYAFSNVLGKFFWYRFDGAKFLKLRDDEIDSTEILPIERGFMPKILRKEAFLCEYGEAWFEDLIAKDRLILSIEDTLDMAVFKLGRPITDLYELPVVYLKHGVQRRWKVNGELVEQNNGGALLLRHYTNPRPRDLPGEYGRFYRIKGFEAEPNVYFYLFEEKDGVHKVRYELEDDGATARLINFDVVGRPEYVDDAEVPEIVRAKRFVLEHGIEWLRERCPSRDGPMDKNGLMLLASLLNCPIWPWQIQYDDTMNCYIGGTEQLVYCWKIENKYLIYCYLDSSASGMKRWKHGFMVERL